MSGTQEAERHEWYEAAPERLEWELAEFAARGLPASAKADDDKRMVVTTELPFAGEQVEIHVAFPHEYPDIEPTVYGPPGLLTRHQTRHVGNFCLLEDPSLDWWPTMSAASLVDEDLRWLLEDSVAGASAVAAGEADMPEPLSQHVSVDSASPVVVPDPFWRHELGVPHGDFAVLHGRIGKGLVFSEADGIGSADRERLASLADLRGSRHSGRWVEIEADSVPTWPTHRQLIEAGLERWPQLLGKLDSMLKRDRKRPSATGFVAVTFMEEGPRRGERRRGWSLLEVELDRKGDWRTLRAHRAQAFTPEERGRRLPELESLAQATVAVVGAGSVGAPIVAELAKAGVGHTYVLDYDYFDVNNGVRHILEPHWAGAQKAIAVAVEAGALNPFVEVTPHRVQIGGGRIDREQLDTLLPRFDVIVDATGSHSATRILQRRCREHGKALLVVSLTAGSFGGEVALFRPDGPCFWCFVLGQQEGTVPSPVEGPRSNTTPVACSTPAFSGAGFDATALGALAARITVQACGHSAYAPLGHDYVIVNFRGEKPWRQGRLEVHPNCPLEH